MAVTPLAPIEHDMAMRDRWWTHLIAEDAGSTLAGRSHACYNVALHVVMDVA
jgi:hypothetical protein